MKTISTKKIQCQIIVFFQEYIMIHEAQQCRYKLSPLQLIQLNILRTTSKALQFGFLNRLCHKVKILEERSHKMELVK